MLLFRKKESTWPPKSPQSNMVIKSRFLEAVHLSSEVSVSHCKDTRKGAQKWHEGTKQLIK